MCKLLIISWNVNEITIKMWKDLNFYFLYTAEQAFP